MELEPLEWGKNISEQKRYVLRSCIYNLSNEMCNENILKNKHIEVIEDRLGGDITQKVVNILYNNGCTITVVSDKNISYQNATVRKCNYSDLNDIKKVFLDVRKEEGHVEGIINLFSLCIGVDFTSIAPKEWEDEIKKTYLISFYSIKAIYEDLKTLKDKAFLFFATNIGGNFGYETVKYDNYSAGISCGFAKAMNRELEELHCKVVDFDDVSESNFISQIIVVEIEDMAKTVEVGYVAGERKSLKLICDELNDKIKKNIFTNQLNEEDVVLFAGGGRGILNAFIQEVIKIANPTIIVIGRSEIPKDEVWSNMDEDEFEKYKTEFIRDRKAEAPAISVMEIINEYNGIANRRKLAVNIKKLNQLSEKVYYYTCDVSNYSNVCALKKIIEERHGNLTAIVNGAGLPSFGILPKKHEKSSLQSIIVKGMGLYNLYNIFKDHPLKFFQNAGSISGRFGIDGQVDYVAACNLVTTMVNKINLMQNKFKCYTIEWTAWKDIGMAANSVVEKVQKERGLNYISVEDGKRKFIEEVLYGGEEEEILIFDTLGKKITREFQLDALSDDLGRVISPISKNGYIIDKTKYPFIDRIIEEDENSLIVEKNLNINNDVHLRDHVVKNNYVFAGVSHIELFAEMSKLIGELNNEIWYLYEIKEIVLKEFVKYFPQNELKLHGKVVIIERKDELIRLQCKLYSDFKNSKGQILLKDREHSYGELIFSKKQYELKMEKRNIKYLLKNSKGLNLEKYYELSKNSIYFGELFRNLIWAKKVNEKEFIGKVLAVDDSKLFTNIKYVKTEVFPITIDCIGRVALMGIFNEYGVVAIPVKLQNIRMQRAIKKKEILYSYEIIRNIEGEEVYIEQEIIDENCNVIMKIVLILHIISRQSEHNLEEDSIT